MVTRKVKEELDRMLSLFGIQVDNPIAILNQDTAKSFLYKCDASKLFQFYMRATQLEDCKRMLIDCTMELDTAKMLLEQKLDAMGELEAEVKKWEKKLEVNLKTENHTIFFSTLLNLVRFSYTKLLTLGRPKSRRKRLSWPGPWPKLKKTSSRWPKEPELNSIGN